MKSIPVQGGSVNAHQEFFVQLGDNLITFNLNYLSTGQWAMDLSREGVTLCSGAMLEPACDIIQSWNLSDDIGAIVLTGEPTTLDNLGIENTLVWVSPDELV